MLSATVNRSGKLKIAGKTNPLAKDLFLDVQLALNDVELPPASPYTGKFVGYTIGKGKLGLSLDYKVANRKLDAKNNLVLDQFTFGDKVASPVATHAPVRLAVALLKDRRGVIDIDLPISGSLDDPHFKVWPAVLKVLGNLVVKAATAPVLRHRGGVRGRRPAVARRLRAGRRGAGRRRPAEASQPGQGAGRTPGAVAGDRRRAPTRTGIATACAGSWSSAS